MLPAIIIKNEVGTSLFREIWDLLFILYLILGDIIHTSVTINEKLCKNVSDEITIRL